MKKQVLLGLALLWVCSSSLAASFFTSSDLLDKCRDDGERSVLCLGFIMGVFDTHQALRENYFCVISGSKISPIQVMAIAQSYMEENPKDWHLPAVYQIYDSLRDAFPCPVNKTEMNAKKIFSLEDMGLTEDGKPIHEN